MKKENYFTPKNISLKSEKYKKRFSRGDEPIDISDTALLILDMQDYFLVPASHAFIPSSSAIIKNISILLNLFRTNKKPIFFTRHLNTKKDAMMMNSWWKNLIKEDDPLSEINKEFEPHSNEIIKKTQYDAFYKTSLLKNLKSKGIKRLVITGVMTHLCCETTARNAFCNGFEVYFCADATATYNEEFHIATLLNLSHGFAKIISIYDILNS